MGPQARREYAADMRKRYAKARSKAERTRLLDEFVAAIRCHRKHAIRALRRPPTPRGPVSRPSRFDAALQEALVAIWRLAGYPWSRRLAALLPLWLPWAERTLGITDTTAALLQTMSARSMDRVLRPHRIELRKRVYGRTKPGTLLKHQIPIRSERWDTTTAGWCEVDTVAHCGDSSFGEFVHSLNVTDVASTWTETRAVLGKGQLHITNKLEEIRTALPFSLLGIDSDSGSEFVNYHCVSWCEKRRLQFTRSRPYKKNDNAHIEQKNWTNVRKIFGYRRIDTLEAVEAMNDLYRNELRIFMNYFQPSVKLVERTRIGSRVRRIYDAPQTPLDRLVALKTLTQEHEQELLAHRSTINPFELAMKIEEQIHAILRLPMSGAALHHRGPKLATPLSVKAAKVIKAAREAPVRTRVAQ
jgi:hypothetical protein